MNRACTVGIGTLLLLGACSDRADFDPNSGCIIGETCVLPIGLPDASVSDVIDDALSEVSTDAAPLTGLTYRFVMDRITLAAPNDQNELPGFNIDGRNSDSMDAMSCNHPDRSAPLPDGFSGVDNELGPALAGLEELLGLQETLQNAIDAGELLLMLDVRGVDVLGNDDEIVVDALLGELPVGVTAPSRSETGFAKDQFFDVSPDSYDESGQPRSSLLGQIRRGRLRAGPGSFALPIPIGDETVMLALDDAQMRFDISDDELSEGVLGGSLLVEDVITTMVNAGLITETSARSILEDLADLRLVDGTCTAVSLGLTIHGVSASSVNEQE